MAKPVMMAKPIILIGGTAGTGKSTLARELCGAMGIDHRLGTGFIREIVKSYNTEKSAPELFSFTFHSKRPVDNLIAQARRLQPAIDGCIKRARDEGTSLVIEGNHLIPALYHDAPVDHYVLLGAPNEEELLSRLHGPSHSKRNIGREDFRNVLRIDDYLRAEASHHGIEFIVYTNNLARFVRLFNAAAIP